MLKLENVLNDYNESELNTFLSECSEDDLYNLIFNSVTISDGNLALKIFQKFPNLNPCDYEQDLFKEVCLHSKNKKLLRHLLNDDRIYPSYGDSELLFSTFTNDNYGQFKVLFKDSRMDSIIQRNQIFHLGSHVYKNKYIILLLQEGKIDPYMLNHSSFIYICDHANVPLIQAFIKYTNYDFDFDYTKQKEEQYFINKIYEDVSLRPHIESYLSKLYGQNIVFEFRNERAKEDLNKKMIAF